MTAVVTSKEAVTKVLDRTFFDEAHVERGYRKCVAAAGGNLQLIVALELERKGGLCPVETCQTPYKRVEVDNRFGKFTYFQPACHCFKKCDVCTIRAEFDENGRVVREQIPRFMVSERLLGIHHCTFCHPNGPEQPKKVRTPRKKEYRGGQDAAAGGNE